MSASTSSATQCAVCGEPRISGAKFCGRCGTTYQAAPRALVRTPAVRRRGTGADLVYVVIAAVLALALSHLPIVDVAIYPFKLFGTFVHEWCHAIVAVVTGGHVTALQINGDLSGETFKLFGYGV